MDTAELNALAAAVMVEGLGPDAVVEAIEKYALGFDAWFNSREKLFASDKSETTVAELRSVVEQHNRVLAVAQNMQGKTALDLKGLRQRGKSIMAYTDHLPRRVSVHAPRKG
ncbi:MAG: hypothetical protein K1X79_14195 [Oligoflexia bacterium]|nr:hypothetical protein [Oligoflexia bacterium]